VQALRFRISNIRFGLLGFGISVEGQGSRAQGLGFRV
jgi:hypothetical protein